MLSRTLFFKMLSCGNGFRDWRGQKIISKKYSFGRHQEVVEENGLLTEKYYSEWKHEMDKQEELKNAVKQYEEVI